MSNTDYYYFRGMLNTLKEHSTDNSTSHDKLTAINAELMYANNVNTAGAIANSHLVTHGKVDATNAELMYQNNTGASGSLAHSGVQILAMNTSINDEIATIKSYQFSTRGTQGNLMSSSGVSCVAAGTTSSVVDWFSSTAVPKRVQVLVTATASVANTGFEIWASHDNSTYARMTVGTSGTVSMTTTNSAGGAINTTGAVTVDTTCRYLKIIVYSLGTYTATAVGLA